MAHDWIVDGVLLVVGLSLVRTAPSAIVWAIRPDHVETDFDDSRSPPNKPQVASLLREVQALGFQILGSRWERSSFLDARAWDVVLSSPADRCFAAVGAWTSKANLFFLTRFNDGALVLTTNLPAMAPIESKELVYGGINKGSPAELLALHRARVAARVAKGLAVVDDIGRASRLEACRAFYRAPAIRRGNRLRGVHATVILAMYAAVLFFVAR